MDIEVIRKCVREGAVHWTIHCEKRLVERDLSRDDVYACLLNGEIIKEYSDDKPFPSCLILGHNDINVELHVVVSNENDIMIHIITAYRPDKDIFEDNLKTRR